MTQWPHLGYTPFLCSDKHRLKKLPGCGLGKASKVTRPHTTGHFPVGVYKEHCTPSQKLRSLDITSGKPDSEICNASKILAEFVMMSSKVTDSQCLEGMYCFPLQGSKKAVHSFETSWINDIATQRINPKTHIFKIYVVGSKKSQSGCHPDLRWVINGACVGWYYQLRRDFGHPC